MTRNIKIKKKVGTEKPIKRRKEIDLQNIYICISNKSLRIFQILQN